MKWLTIIASTLIAIVIITFCFIYFGFASILEWNLSTKISTKISIAKSSFSLSSIQLENFRIHNPKNINKPYALEIDSINIQAPLFNYFKKITEIQSIKLDNIVLSIEFLEIGKGEGSNWNLIMRSANKKGSSKPGENDPSYANINLLSLKNITVIVYQGGREKNRKVIPLLTFKNIKTKKDELTRRITQAILFNLLFDFKNILDFPIELIPEASEPLNLFDNVLPKL
jgi:hypothetical protein